ncbi:MAG: adenylate kinase [Clostridiales bacterium]|nr:adenylate kinase [Clostridiales bacterium]
MKLMFLGAPGAGKGTQAEKVSEKYGIPSISTGAILREAMANGSELGLVAKSYCESGALVPDDVVIGIIKERLSNDDCKNGFILDGFPRTEAQAKALDAMGIEMDMVISIEVSDDDIVKRMSGRRLCSKCGASYHVIHIPTKVEGICDKCGAELITRADDKPEVVLGRLATYHEQTEPLKDYYAAKNKLVLINGVDAIDSITKKICGALDGIRG